jgi:hypothetical protein
VTGDKKIISGVEMDVRRLGFANRPALLPTVLVNSQKMEFFYHSRPEVAVAWTDVAAQSVRCAEISSATDEKKAQKIIVSLSLQGFEELGTTFRISDSRLDKRNNCHNLDARGYSPPGCIQQRNGFFMIVSILYPWNPRSGPFGPLLLSHSLQNNMKGSHISELILR